MIRYHSTKIFNHFPIIFPNSHFSFIANFLILAHILDHLHQLVFILPEALTIMSQSIYIYFSIHFLFKIKSQLSLEAYFHHILPIMLSQILILLYFFIKVYPIHFIIFIIQFQLTNLQVYSKASLLLIFSIQY